MRTRPPLVLLLVLALVATACIRSEQGLVSAQGPVTKDNLPRCPLGALKGAAGIVEVELWHGLPEMRAERGLIGHALDQDARLRGHDAASKLPAVVMERLGPSPACGPERELWQDTAGQVAQHHDAFDLHGTTVAGPTPRPFGQDAYVASHWSALQAVERLDRALGRQLEIERLPDRWADPSES